jgi:hypothetical protein
MFVRRLGEGDKRRTEEEVELSELPVPKTDPCKNRGHNRAEIKERKVRKTTG